MEHPSFLLLILAIGFTGGFIGNIISGTNALISISAMILAGMPPQLAVATHMTGGLGWSLGGLIQFQKAQKIVWKLVWPMAALAFAGSMIGANILVKADPVLLNQISGFLILLILPFLFLNKNMGIESFTPAPSRRYFGYGVYFLIAIWAGFFAAGSGIFVAYVYLGLFGLTILEYKGTDKIPCFFLCAGAAIVYIMHGFFDPAYLACSLGGQFLGATFGAKYAIKLGDRKLRAIMLGAVAFMGIRLIFR